MQRLGLGQDQYYMVGGVGADGADEWPSLEQYPNQTNNYVTILI